MPYFLQIIKINSPKLPTTMANLFCHAELAKNSKINASLVKVYMQFIFIFSPIFLLISTNFIIVVKYNFRYSYPNKTIPQWQLHKIHQI